MKCNGSIFSRLGMIGSTVFLAFAAVAAPTNLSPNKTAEDPVQLFSEEQYNYLYNMDQPARSSVLKNKQMETAVFCNGSPLTLSWKNSSGTCTVTVKRLLDGSEFWTGTTSGTSVSVVNLEVGAGYAWTVTDSSGSAEATFYTRPEPPRLIKSGTMQMMRDLGGWEGLEGCRIRQNQIFRGGPANNGAAPDDAAKDFFFNVVGLKNEIDFRGEKEAADDGTPIEFDSEGDHVTYQLWEIDYNKIYTKSDLTSGSKGEHFAKSLKLLMNVGQVGRPAYFHCAVGRDRTGTMAAVLLAVLGVKEADIVRDYQSSAYKGEDVYSSSYMNGGFKNFLANLAKYKSTSMSLAENAAEYCKTLGVTDEQIETFRKEMLIGYGEPDWWTEEPRFVTATRTKLKAGKATEVQYTGFETKKGCAYAWGKDGEAKTEWKESDGTPMELAKPDGDGWELMVRE